MINIKKIIISLVLFLSFSYAQAQTEADQIRNDKAFQEILEKDIAFNVEDNSFQVFYEFQQLVPEEFFNFGEEVSDFREWISSRIDDSGFESVEDAVAKYKTFTDVTNRNYTKSLELGKEIRMVKEKFDNKELFDKVFMEELKKGLDKLPVKPLE